MPRAKKGRGRPSPYPYPPRIDATSSEIARTVLQAKPKRRFFDPPAQERDYCARGEREVHYPETLYRDGLCATGHAPTP